MATATPQPQPQAAPPPRRGLLDDYVTVAERIESFYGRYPEGRIVTAIVEHDPERGFVLMRAEVFRMADDASPSASGHAYEVKAEGMVNKTSYIENSETSAVGRALAILGFHVRRAVASRNEMIAAQKAAQDQKLPLIKDIRALWVKLHEIGAPGYATKQEVEAFLQSWCQAKRLGVYQNLSGLSDEALAEYLAILRSAAIEQERRITEADNIRTEPEVIEPAPVQAGIPELDTPDFTPDFNAPPPPRRNTPGQAKATPVVQARSYHDDGPPF